MRVRSCRRCSPEARWRSPRSACSMWPGSSRQRRAATSRGQSSWRRRRCARSSGSCVRQGCVPLIASLASSSPRGLRDRAIILCMARLGLRGSEVVQLRLEDLDWRNAVLRVRARKTGHGAVLPLTAQVGAALAGYLQHGRPDTTARQVFVLHRLRTGAPISGSIVGRAVDNALRRAGMDAPVRGGNLLRHSLATDLLVRGASLPGIADLFGHSSLATTRVYAAVDVAALREVALPWPQATS